MDLNILILMMLSNLGCLRKLQKTTTIGARSSQNHHFRNFLLITLVLGLSVTDTTDSTADAL